MWRGELIAALLFAGVSGLGCAALPVPHTVNVSIASPDHGKAVWQHLPVEYCIDESTSGFVTHEALVALTREAFEQWGVAAAYKGNCIGGQHAANGRNEIAWGPIPGDDQALNQVGLTNVRTEACPSCPLAGLKIIEADITLNPHPPPGWDTKACLRTTLLHEVGHFLGAGHLEPPALMAAVTTSCPQRLTAADLGAIARLYATTAQP